MLFGLVLTFEFLMTGRDVMHFLYLDDYQRDGLCFCIWVTLYIN